MFLVTTAVFPPDKSQKVAEKYIKAAAKELPPFLKRLQVAGQFKDRGRHQSACHF